MPNPTLNKIIARVAKEEGVDPNLIYAIVAQESGGKSDAVSKKGAQGLMQLMPGTSVELGLKPGEAFDPEKNIRAGVKYLKRQLNRFGGDVELALAAYNAGPGSVQKYGGVPPFGETQAYVSKVLGRMESTSTVSATAPTTSRGVLESSTDVSGEREVRTATYATPEEAALAEEAAAGQEPPATADIGAPAGAPAVPSPSDLDPLMKELFTRILTPHDASPTPQPLSPAQRFLAGVIAAADPEAYKTLVLPELERRGEQAKTLALMEETARTRDISALQALASLQASMAARETAAGQRQEQLDINQQRLAIAEEEALARKMEQERKLEEARQIVGIFDAELANIAGEMTPIIERLTSTDEAVKQARGESLARELAGVEGIISGFAASPQNVGPATVQLLDRQLAALRRTRDNALAAETAEARARNAAAQRVAGKHIAEHAEVSRMLERSREARTLIRAGAGGPGTGALPEWGWIPGAADRAKLNAIYGDIQPKRIRDVIGGAMVEHELALLKGTILDSTDAAFRQEIALDAVEGILKGHLKGLNLIFLNLGVDPPGAFGFERQLPDDAVPEDAIEFGTLDGKRVIQVGPSPYDQYVWEDE